MEALMPNGIAQLIVAAAIALAMTIASIGSAVAQSPLGQPPSIAPEALVNRYASPVSKTDVRLGDHQQLRKLLLN
jgi:hypothetical protein